jgi:hypothetical protein
MFDRVRKVWNRLGERTNEDDSPADPVPLPQPAQDAESEPAGFKVQFCYNNKTVACSNYRYSPLPAAIKRPIRLLSLLPGSEDADIHCRLRTANLDALDTADKQDFEALSYVWGDAKDTTPIQINDATICIGKNLRSALLHLRNKNQARTLWVDAVCINQGDINECNNQVPLMGDIYTKAVRTVVWLGCPCCLLGTARPDLSSYQKEKLREQVVKVQGLFAVINFLGQEAAIVAEEGRQVIPKKGEQHEEGTTYDLIRKIGPEWNLIFFDNPWWSRVWTLQEIVVAQDAVLCMSTEEVGWGFFRDAIAHYKALGFETFSETWFGNKTKSGLEPLDMVQSIKDARESEIVVGEVGDELLYYLASSHWRDCKEPQDKIYGILGLFSKDRDVGIQADYRSDPADVYRRATKALLQRSGNLDVLGFCFPFKVPRVTNLPSWVPDWGSSGNLALPLMNDAKGKLRTTHASRGLRSNPRWEDDDEQTLVLQGHIVDVVTKLGSVQPAVQMDDRNEGSLDHLLKNPEILAAAESFPATWDDVDPERPYRHILSEFWKGIKVATPFVKTALSDLTNVVTHKERYIEWQDLVTAELNKTSTPNANPDTLFRDTLTTSTDYPSGPAETQTRFEEWLKALSSIRRLKSTRLDRMSPTMFKSLGFIAGVWKAIDEDDDSFSTYTSHTARRRMGFTQSSLVCLLPQRTEMGDKIALLRGGRVPVVFRPKGDGSVEFIGEAYVHGIMDGEGFDEGKCVDFRIR